MVLIFTAPVPFFRKQVPKSLGSKKVMFAPNVIATQLFELARRLYEAHARRQSVNE